MKTKPFARAGEAGRSDAFAGTRLSVSLDGKRYIDSTDDRSARAGRVGLRTKADSMTAFGEFARQAARPQAPGRS